MEGAMDLSKMDYITSTFLMVQSEINRVAYNQVPYQNIHLKLGGGSLILDPDNNVNNITLYVNGTNFSCRDSLEYSYKGTHMAYINGGVYQLYNSGSAEMISPPRTYVRQNMTYVSLYHLTGYISRGGAGNELLLIEYNTTQVNKYQPAPGNNLTIMLEGPYADVQGRYLEGQGFFRTVGTNYTIASEYVIITQYFLSVKD